MIKDFQKISLPFSLNFYLLSQYTLIGVCTLLHRNVTIKVPLMEFFNGISHFCKWYKTYDCEKYLTVVTKMSDSTSAQIYDSMMAARRTADQLHLENGKFTIILVFES